MGTENLNNRSTKNFTGWNRSSALKPETIALLNGTIMMAVDAAIQNFKRAVDFESLTPEQQNEAGQLLVNNTSAAVAEAAEKLLAMIPVDANGRI
jgi:hypothetical protein